MMFPGIALLFLFNYMPMIGLQIAFRDFQLGSTMWTSPWVGFQNFEFLSNPEFWKVVRNTIAIAFWKFFFGFPAPIVLALLLNEIRVRAFKRLVQSVSYLPHFVSWIIIAYMLEALLSPYDGVVNRLIGVFGGEPIFFLGDTDWFRPIVVISAIWKEIGWNSIIYLAAISTLNPHLYEAAYIDGAGKWAQLVHITLPGLVPTISILLILGIPGLLNAGFDQIYPLMNPANLPVSDVLDTYILRNGLQQGYYSMATAIGFLSSAIGMLLVLMTNYWIRKMNGESLW
jgi:putative aldouronate transport system permease protein